MNYIFILIITVIGLSGMAAQVLLLRELLIIFYGNELTLGIILSNWAILEAMGAYLAGRLIDNSKKRLRFFFLLQAFFTVSLPACVYLTRTFKSFLGIPFGEGLGLAAIFLATLIILLPVSFSHGALFSCICRIYSERAKQKIYSIGRTYALETIGAIIGGVLLTYFLIPRFNTFASVFIVLIINTSATLLFLKALSSKLKYKLAAVLLLFALVILGTLAPQIQRDSLERIWPRRLIVDYRNSLYGNIAAVRNQGQYSFYYDGFPIITVPFPDMEFTEEFGNLPLLFSPYPQKVLIVGGGIGGLINQVLKHPVSDIDYLELDPTLIEIVRKAPVELIKRELDNPRVKVISQDAKYFLKNNPGKYDLILIGIGQPQNLTTNRYFSEEFFLLAKERLRPDGILALHLPGSLTYMSIELRDLNASIINGLNRVYPYLRIIPGNYNIFLASGGTNLQEINAKVIDQRITKRGIPRNILIPAYLEYRLNPEWLELFERNMLSASAKINSDFRPIALFEALSIWNDEFSPGFNKYFVALKGVSLPVFAASIGLLTLLLFILCRFRPRIGVVYSIGTTGFFGMMANLLLLFSFQVNYGYLYHKIGLLISFFMAGAAVGSIVLSRKIKTIKTALKLLVAVEGGIILFLLFLASVIKTLDISWAFPILIFITGLFIGLEFPLAGSIYQRGESGVGRTAGVLYFFDLFGGWFAGMLGGVVFMPILGIRQSCIIMVMLKMSSSLVLLSSRKSFVKNL